MERKFEIYGLFDIREPDVIRYVGQSKSRKGVADRIYHHKWDARNNRKVYPVQRWINEIGEDNLGYRILHVSLAEGLDRQEIETILHFRILGQADLNVLSGGQGASSEDVSGEKNPRAHLTWQSVRALRKRATQEYVSAARESVVLGIQPAAVSKILLNASWFDPEYDPSKRITFEDHNSTETNALVLRTVPNPVILQLREEYLSGATVAGLVKSFNLPRTTVSRCLFEMYADKDSRERCVAERERRGRRTLVRKTREEIALALKLHSEGLTQSQIAKIIGATQSGVSYILKHNRGAIE